MTFRSPAVAVSHLGITLSQSIILNDISFSVSNGTILGILGPSGSGKTTLLRSLVGMYAATTGDISYFGKKAKHADVLKSIGYMTQADALYEDLSGWDNLVFFASLYNMNHSKAEKRARELLDLTDLTGHEKKPVRLYSGGMKKRLSLAIALIHEPDILILDEPTVGIDPVLRKVFWDHFRELQSAGKTILVSTHVMDEAERCDELALLFEGQLLSYSTPEILKQNTNTKTVEDAFLTLRLQGGGK